MNQEDDPFQTVTPSSPAQGPILTTTAPAEQDKDVPERIGRYHIEKILGEGGFGRVYLAYDEELRRHVAVKVPRAARISRPEDVESFLAEARTLANLDHPNIVPVHDVGRTEDGLCFVVSKLIQGSDLSKKMKAGRLSLKESVELVITAADALHYAHHAGLVHRDVKPANILIDTAGKAYVADFGLALKEEDYGKGAGFAGTPAYMSPEQARGEGHRVDGRSDIFSLGVLFYELLAGRRPFREESADELLSQITSQDPRPPRQIDDLIPKELERVCLKALSKRASDRYTTANDMADDLRHFLAESTEEQKHALRSISVAPPPPTGHSAAALSTPTPGPVGTLTSDHRPIKIVPKGLRSFDERDADFFLELLPGPRDREGLPDSIRFWKSRIETTDGDETFSVGLLYGPSGCGKSSLLKAGVLPRLSTDVLVVYAESTDTETETRLLQGLRKRCPDLPDGLGLKESMTALRRGQGVPKGKMLLIVLDQFEQWLNANKEKDNTELVQALRQCDGGRVQCIVMVRDDFWMAATRFMRELEIRLVEGQNSAAVDLFPVRHAEKVLAAFGRAFGTLPEKAGDISKDHKRFLEHSAQGLAQDGKVICVRLALFAEMMKGKSWTPATLKEVGGTSGVGLTFLEETFSADTAPPDHRYHQKGARAVLKALLPGAGTKIKGHMRSYRELLEASGYAGRPADFAGLIRILDSEVRLITPTDPEGNAEGPAAPTQIGQMYYQLAHDYLVHSLRDWLTLKQKETARGRAELLLADRASIWDARMENRQLPSLVQWASIRLLTHQETWTEPQRKMMGKATKLHMLHGAILAIVVAAFGLAGLTVRSQVVDHNKSIQAAGLVRRLIDANITQVPAIVGDIAPYRKWADPLLQEEWESAPDDSRQKLRASLALLPVDPGQVDYLYEQVLVQQNPEAIPVIRDSLLPYKDTVAQRLWAVIAQSGRGEAGQNIRAACLLARYEPESKNWDQFSAKVVEEMVSENPIHLGSWIQAFQPVKAQLAGPLSSIFRDAKRRDSERTLATNILAEYAGDEPARLTDLLLDADDKQFAVLFPKVKDHRDQGLAHITSELNKLSLADAKEDDKERLAKRQATAAVVLLRMGQAEKVWPLLKFSPDPRMRSYLIHRFNLLGADPKVIVQRSVEEKDLSVERALLQSLGEYSEDALSYDERKRLQARFLDLYRNHPDPGIHASAEWLLRQWKQDKAIKEIEMQLSKDKEERANKIERISQNLSNQAERNPQWYVNGQGQTLVVLRGPAEFLMGSPRSEIGRTKEEALHRERIGRSFAIAAKSVTVEQYLRFRKDYSYRPEYAPTTDCPAHSTIWYQAVEYCNWLSKEEGLPESEWCYEPNKNGKYEEGMKLAPDYLKRNGYRLPTEAEWEYACRSGTITSRYYGESEELLDKYGFSMTNSSERTWAVGTLKPNDWGLFDMHGNVYSWCQERERPFAGSKDGPAIEDAEDALLVTDKDARELRGSSFGNRGLNLRSARRYRFVPTFRASGIGFRVARTFR